MERHQKLRESMITDELAVTRAAAWAWYQRGSGSDPESTSEFGLTRTHRVPNPTRYKLEAERRSSSSTSDHGSHLLDRYEIESISRHLEKYIERGSSNRSYQKKVEEKKKSSKGFWLMRHHGVACGGARDDVVEFGRREVRERWPRRPEKGGGGVVGVAAAVISRPRTTHD